MRSQSQTLSLPRSSLPVRAGLLPMFLLTLLAGCQQGPFPSTLAALENTPPAPVTLDIREWRTDEGARVLFVPTRTLPIVDVRLVFAAGSSRDGDLPGVARMTSALIGEGAETLSVDDIARRFEDLGVNFSTSSYRDMGVIELRSLSDPQYLRPAVDLMIPVISAPNFPLTSLDRVRRQTLIAIQRQKQVPGPQVHDRYNEVLFGEHPYAHPSEGTSASLKAMGRADLFAFHKQYYRAANAVIALTGDLDEEQARALAARISAALPGGDKPEPLPRATTAKKGVREHLTFDSSQTHILIGQQSIWRGHPDRVPLYVGNQILGGGGFSSILMDEVRQQRGLVYGISSGFSPMSAAGPFSIQLQTATDNASGALALTLELLNDFIATGPTEQQLRDAVDNIIGSSALDVAENDDIVGHLGSIGFYDLPLDYLSWFDAQVRQVTVEDIRAAFARHVQPEALHIVSIGRQAP